MSDQSSNERLSEFQRWNSMSNGSRYVDWLKLRTGLQSIADTSLDVHRRVRQYARRTLAGSPAPVVPSQPGATPADFIYVGDTEYVRVSRLNAEVEKREHEIQQLRGSSVETSDRPAFVYAGNVFSKDIDGDVLLDWKNDEHEPAEGTMLFLRLWTAPEIESVHREAERMSKAWSQVETNEEACNRCGDTAQVTVQTIAGPMRDNCPECTELRRLRAENEQLLADRDRLREVNQIALSKASAETISGRLATGTSVKLLRSVLGCPVDGWVIENIDEPRELKYRIRHPNGGLLDVLPELVSPVTASGSHIATPGAKLSGESSQAVTGEDSRPRELRHSDPLTEVRDRSANAALTCSGACRYNNGVLVIDPACETHRA